MPTIDQLEAAVVAADDDVIPVSQGGTARRVTRSQLLAGTQSSLALNSGLLGRVSAGFGPPQQVSLGRNLSITDGVLNGPPPFSATTLPRSSSVNLSDLVPVWQGGSGQATDLRTLLSVGGIDVSRQVATSAIGVSRELGAWFGDALTVEAFGAVGDGVTNDSLAFSLALASGRPLLLGPKVYRIDGQFNVIGSAVMIGVAGSSVLRRSVQKGGAWINVLGPKFVAKDIVFDAGSVSGDSWGVLVGSKCVRTEFRNCGFINSTGPTLGTGLTIQSCDGADDSEISYTIDSCHFSNNGCHGLWLQAVTGAVVSRCLASNNTGYGICLDFNDPSFQQKVRQSSVIGCRCISNSRGISIGNYNETNLEPPRWGLQYPDAVDIVASGNFCLGNRSYGIAVSGERIQVIDNQIVVSDTNEVASGILCNVKSSLISGNSISGPGQYGIDAGGCNDVTLKANSIVNCAVGINPGGSTRVDVVGNKLLENRRAITIFQIETDGSGSNFGIACSDVNIAENTVSCGNGNAGVLLFDGPERVRISGNRFVSSSVSYHSDCFWGHSDSISIADNTWNGAKATLSAFRQTEAGVTLVVGDLLNEALVPPSLDRINTISGVYEAEMNGKLSFVRVTDGGQNYASADVVVIGGGSGAKATAYIRDGTVVGIAVTDRGYGYDPDRTTIHITGDGDGAEAQAFVGVPPPNGHTLTLNCPTSVSFSNEHGLSNWTGAIITAPARTDIVWRYANCGWTAVRFFPNTYVQPVADGGISLRSAQGDLRIQPGPDGHVRICSDIEPTGYLSCLGRGSPEGVVAAPPGSDYRNLDGGIGATLWLKTRSDDANGWTALA